MGRNGDWMQRLRDQMALDAQTLPGVPLVEIAGQNRVLIENHRGVKEYGPETICVHVKFGMLRICGSKLHLRCMTRSKLVISGCIESINIHRRATP